MNVALKLYEQLVETDDERQRLRLIADAIAALDDRWLDDGVRARDLRETELRLQKEIEQVRLEIEQVRLEAHQVRLELQKQSEQTRLELEKQIERTRLELEKQIEQLRKDVQEIRHEIQEIRHETQQVRLEVERVRAEGSAMEARLNQAMHRQTIWIIGAVGTIVAAIRLLDYLLA